MVERVFDMHATQYAEALKNDEFKKEFDFAKLQVRKKRVLGAQRLLPPAGPLGAAAQHRGVYQFLYLSLSLYIYIYIYVYIHIRQHAFC